MFGGNFVNRFNIAGRSYKVIPQVQRAGRLNPNQLNDIYVTGPNDKLIPLSTVATIREKTVPRTLNRLKQLNAVTISGVSSLPLDQALKLLEDEAAQDFTSRILDRLHRRIAPAPGRGRQVPARLRPRRRSHFPRPRGAV